ncbi:MAG TPA: energy transducer TonB, partial [Rubrivivax sp.]|nr:energy transducer TonB [Rubrivivax sp.]
ESAPQPVVAVVATAPAPPASPPPPARRVVAATAVQYLVLPPVEVPRASRRAGESGMVWLKVVVNVAGLPSSVQVHRSSGFPRLDEQAVWAMRQARFKPQTEDGAPVELEVTAPIEYLLE